jgi:hypothetical protein
MTGPAQPRPRRRRRSSALGGGTIAAAALMVAAVATLAGNDPLAVATEPAFDLEPSSGASPSPAANGSVPTTVAGGVAGSPGRGFTAASPTGGRGDGEVPTIPAEAAAPPAAPGGGDAAPPSTPDPEAATPAVVSPVLQFFAFGGRVGMPLVCSLTAGAAGPALTDPAVAAIAGEIVSSCASSANQGADALLELDRNLAALAAANPVVQPALDELAASLEAARDVPFGRSLVQLAALVRFLRG